MTATVTQLVPRHAVPGHPLPEPDLPYDAVLCPRGELGFAAAARLRTLLDDLVGVGFDRVVLDLGNVETMDRAAVAVLTAARRRLAAQGTALLLQAPSPGALAALTGTALTAALAI